VPFHWVASQLFTVARRDTLSSWDVLFFFSHSLLLLGISGTASPDPQTHTWTRKEKASEPG
jgi:hypothetical protein